MSITGINIAFKDSDRKKKTKIEKLLLAADIRNNYCYNISEKLLLNPNRACSDMISDIRDHDFEQRSQASEQHPTLVYTISTLHHAGQEIPHVPVSLDITQKPTKQGQNVVRRCGCNEDRVHIPYCEIDIVHGCNLRCEQCSHFSPFRGGFSTKEDIIDWLEQWSQKICPNVINLLGGEPFLHPDLIEIIRGSRRVFPNAEIEITTNGLLLPRIPPVVFETLQEVKVKVIVSDHTGNDISFLQILDCIDLLRKQKVHYIIRSSNKQWHASYLWNEENLPIPFRSNPRLAWLSCDAKNCKSLMNNRFYKCSILANIAKSVEEGVLSAMLWKTALTYKPLTLDSTLEEIAAHFDTRAIPECCNCPEHLTAIENKQLAAR